VSLDDFDDDEEYEPHQKIREVNIDEIERDWKNRLIYFGTEYLNAQTQYKSLQKDKKDTTIELFGWYDPNQRLYFYEKHSKGEERTGSDLLDRINALFGIGED
jgi:hypothetical protein